MVKVRTEYSFRSAAGKIATVMERLVEAGYGCAPISDTASTFGFTRWTKLAKSAGLKPIYGVELAVTDSVSAKKPSADRWSFFAQEELVGIHGLVGMAGRQFRYEPLLTYQQAQSAKGVTKITGHKPNFEFMQPADDLFVAIGPSSATGMVRRAQELGYRFIATSDNRYPREQDRAFYEVVCGRDASMQSYPQHILNEGEWRNSVRRLPEDVIEEAWANAQDFKNHHSATMKSGSLLVPEKPQTLEQMCIDGARKLGVDLNDEVYAARLKRELELIAIKKFEDYFYIVADVVSWARERMVVGPARGSSCGSLVCYLLGITTIDPIPYKLIFERFIDLNRNDLPDVDVDFSDTSRHLVFEYMEEKYGRDRIARLGTVAMYQPRSALKEAGAALDIPPWEITPVIESLIQRSSGDSRALNTLEDTLTDTPAGQALLRKYPGVMAVKAMEGHARHHSQHAAGIVVTEHPVGEYVAIDGRTGATHCDKKDAEAMDLLKIDALGLTQLSVFEDAMADCGMQIGDLEKIPLDDQATFDVLNERRYAGIFQFNGMALQSLAKQIKFTHFDDIVAITALARPGPLASGGANEWVKRKIGLNEVTYPHECFKPYLEDTKGIVVFQETVMEIGRNVGGLSWEDVTALRKAMSKSLGKEYFDQFGDKWKLGAAKLGVPPDTMNKVWDDLCAYGSWCIDGDTEVALASKGNNLSGKITIADLYEKYMANPSSWIKQNKRMPVLVSYDGSEGRPQMALSIQKNGVKDCWTYSFSDGSEVTCTEDHQFLINGEWKCAKESSVGDHWASLEKYKTERVATVGKGHAKGKSWKHAEISRKGDNNVAWTNGASAAANEFKRAKEGCSCEDCGAIESRMEAHHNDFCSGKKEPTNLSWLCVSCHKKRHYAAGRNKRWRHGEVLSSKELIGVKFAGPRVTYDIEMPVHHNFKLANSLITHNSFNKSHAVAYGMISYWCAWFKAHHPVEFAAATLTHESDANKQIVTLREMAAEGISFLPVHRDHSEEKWKAATIDGVRQLVGPLQNVVGLGPKLVQQIMSAKARQEPFPPRAEKLLNNPKTSLDSLFPIRDAFLRLMPDPAARNIHTPASRLIDLQMTGTVQRGVVVFVVVTKIAPRDENELINIQKRGYKVDGPHFSLNLIVGDDTDSMLAKVRRFDYEDVGKPIVERGKPGKALYAMKGDIGANFRMMDVKVARYIGCIDD